MYLCVRCGHDWNTRITGRPCNCPQCKSPLWDRPRTSVQKVRLAHSLVHRAIKAGKLIPQPCKVCGTDKRVVAHHEDYDRPLEVDWYCNRHHQLRHVEIGDALAEVVDHNGKTGCTLHIDDEILDHAATLAKEQNRTPSYFLRMWLVAGMAKELGLDPSIVEQANVDFRNCSGRKKLAEQKKSEIVPPAQGAEVPRERMRFPQWSIKQLKELADAEPGGLMACSPELLEVLKEAAKTDEGVAERLRYAGVQIPEISKAEHDGMMEQVVLTIDKELRMDAGLPPLNTDTQHYAGWGGPHLLRDRKGNTAFCGGPGVCKFCIDGVPPTGDHQRIDTEEDLTIRCSFTLPPFGENLVEDVSEPEWYKNVRELEINPELAANLAAGKHKTHHGRQNASRSKEASEGDVRKPETNQEGNSAGRVEPGGKGSDQSGTKPARRTRRSLGGDSSESTDQSGQDGEAKTGESELQRVPITVKILAEKIPGVGSAADLPKPKAPLCKKEGHGGFWRSDGYWCAKCGKLYREG